MSLKLIILKYPNQEIPLRNNGIMYPKNDVDELVRTLLSHLKKCNR